MLKITIVFEKLTISQESLMGGDFNHTFNVKLSSYKLITALIFIDCLRQIEIYEKDFF